MKVKFSNIPVFFFGILLGSSLPALAQDGAPAPTPIDPKEINVNPELNANEDKTFVIESNESLKPSGATNTAKETAAKAVATKPKAEAKAGEKEETDPMSFNFLYILIQKFKFSDMVD